MSTTLSIQSMHVKTIILLVSNVSNFRNNLEEMEFVNIPQTGPYKVAFLCRPEITLEEIFRKLRPLGKVVAIDRTTGPRLCDF